MWVLRLFLSQSRDLPNMVMTTESKGNLIKNKHGFCLELIEVLNVNSTRELDELKCRADRGRLFVF